MNDSVLEQNRPLDGMWPFGGWDQTQSRLYNFLFPFSENEAEAEENDVGDDVGAVADQLEDVAMNGDKDAGKSWQRMRVIDLHQI